MLQAMATGADRAGANVINQVRYKFGADSPPGFAAVIVLDESHCSVHTYADEGKMAMDIFTCGSTDPQHILDHIQSLIDLGTIAVQRIGRFDACGTRTVVDADASTPDPVGLKN